jgi:TolA-binding protein
MEGNRFMEKMAFIVTTVMIFGIAGLSGCSSITMLRTRELKAESDTLGMQIDSLKIEILAKQETEVEMLRLIRADQQIRFTELEKKISDLASSISESQYRLSRLDEKTADFQKQFKAKLDEIQKLFQIATADFTTGRFDISLSGFKDLMSRFPESSESQESQYWIAECNYAKKEYEEAAQGYLLYMKQNPQGAKVCVALYKLGLAYDKQNKSKSKDLVWKKLNDQCPDSEEAKLIKSRTK